MKLEDFRNRLARLVASGEIQVHPKILSQHGLGQWGEIFDAIGSGIADAASWIGSTASTVMNSGAVSSLISAVPGVAKAIIGSKQPVVMAPQGYPSQYPSQYPQQYPTPYPQQYPQQVATQQLANQGYYFSSPQSQQFLQQAMTQGVYGSSGQTIVQPVPQGQPSFLTQLPSWTPYAVLGVVGLLLIKRSR